MGSRLAFTWAAMSPVTQLATALGSPPAATAASKYSGKCGGPPGGAWLAPVAAVYMLGRVAHGVGMDGGTLG